MQIITERSSGLALAAGVIVGWEAFSRLGIIDAVLISSPTRIAAAALRLGSTGVGSDLAYSAAVFASAMALALFLGTGLGVLIGLSPVAHSLLNPIIVALNALPKVALMPLVVLWFGIGFSSGVFVAALMASFPIVTATAGGLRALERDHLNVARAFGAGRWFTFLSVLLPGITPYLLSGARVGVNYALVGVILAEFFASSRGVGYRMVVYMQNFDVDGFFACLVLVASFALLCTALFRGLERRVEGWRASAFEPSRGL